MCTIDIHRKEPKEVTNNAWSGVFGGGCSTTAIPGGGGAYVVFWPGVALSNFF